MGLKVGCFIDFLYPPEESLLIEKVTSMNRFVIKETGLKAGCLTGFHCVMNMNVHMHAYCYPLFENASKTGL